MTREEILLWLDKLITAYDDLLKVSKLAPTDALDYAGNKRVKCHPVSIEGHIPLYDDAFDKVAFAVGAIVTYNPNWRVEGDKKLGYKSFKYKGKQFHDIWEWG